MGETREVQKWDFAPIKLAISVGLYQTAEHKQAIEVWGCRLGTGGDRVLVCVRRIKTRLKRERQQHKGSKGSRTSCWNEIVKMT